MAAVFFCLEYHFNRKSPFAYYSLSIKHAFQMLIEVKQVPVEAGCGEAKNV